MTYVLNFIIVNSYEQTELFDISCVYQSDTKVDKKKHIDDIIYEMTKIIKHVLMHPIAMSRFYL